MKDKQWLLNELRRKKKSLEDEPFRELRRISRGIGQSIELVEQLEEPQKQAVPQFVADWFENNKRNLTVRIYNLSVTIFHKEAGELDDFENWFKEAENNSITTLVRMKDGYTIEEEAKYIVKFPSSMLSTPSYGAIVTKNGKKEMGVIYGSSGLNIKPNKYTEKEIKEVDERYWEFA